MGKIIHYGLTVPCDFIRNISIPPSDEENWTKWRTFTWPVPALLLFYLFGNCMFHRSLIVYKYLPEED